MESFLRSVIDNVVAGKSVPAEKLEKIRDGVPITVLTNHWNEAILILFMEKGDTAYAREGYGNAVNLIEKHLLYK